MKAEEIHIEYLFRAGNQYRIPLWQRKFSWGREEWEELYLDIVRVQGGQGISHFLGSVVAKQLPWKGLPSEAHPYLIVDGQQRLTTLTLLLCAIRDRLSQFVESESDAKREADEFTSQLLRNTNLAIRHQERLVLQERDKALLDPIVEQRWDGNSAGAIDHCYLYFKERLSDLDEASVNLLLSTTLSRLTAVWVMLEEEDNVHRVFQTLNAGGKQLRQADLVRNYFFLLLRDQGDEFYANHWRGMENDLGDKDLQSYLSAWTITQGYAGSDGSLFAYFQTDLRGAEHAPDAVAKYGLELCSTAVMYRWIQKPSDSPYGAKLKVTMTDLANWGTVPCAGLILLLLRWNQSGKLAEPHLEQCLEFLLSFMARRHLAGFEPNLHRSIFVTGARRLRAGEDLSSEEKVDYLKYILSSGSDLRAWPSDQEVLAASTQTPVYTNQRSKWIFTILERINRGMYQHSQHSPGVLDRGKYSVEHVMPQTLTSDWEQDLYSWGVESPGQIHQQLLHVLGNLTITPINSHLGNQRFEDKTQKLEDDSQPINQRIADSASWTEARIGERGREMAGIAVRVFEEPLSGSESAAASKKYASLYGGTSEESEDSDDEELF